MYSTCTVSDAPHCDRLNQTQTTQQGIKVPTSCPGGGDGEPLGVLRQHPWSRAERSSKRGARRNVPQELDYWIPTIKPAPVLGEKTIQIERNPQPAARKANLLLRGMQLTI